MGWSRQLSIKAETKIYMSIGTSIGEGRMPFEQLALKVQRNMSLRKSLIVKESVIVES
jgi:hypothetical protein